MKKLDHGMLLDGKYVMDNAMCELERFKELIPERLHGEFETLKDRLESTLAQCDIVEEMTAEQVLEQYEFKKK